MGPAQELQIRKKQEVAKKDETTVPTRLFVPSTDIYEKDETLFVVMEMPGVDKKNVDIRIEDGVLKVEGRLDFSTYQGLQPLYTEYNIGHYTRSFSLSDKIDANKIEADMKDGVLSLMLPKAESAKPRAIQVK
jgi:HSP20 family protein